MKLFHQVKFRNFHSPTPEKISKIQKNPHQKKIIGNNQFRGGEKFLYDCSKKPYSSSFYRAMNKEDITSSNTFV
jgi:hypothetical protein